jgi:hypothetical protein
VESGRCGGEGDGYTCLITENMINVILDKVTYKTVQMFCTFEIDGVYRVEY